MSLSAKSGTRTRVSPSTCIRFTKEWAKFISDLPLSWLYFFKIPRGTCRLCLTSHYAVPNLSWGSLTNSVFPLITFGSFISVCCSQRPNYRLQFWYKSGFPPCPLVQNTGSRTSVSQYTSHTLIHNSCDIDWRVWRCWQYFVINKSRVHYLVIGKSWCLGHCFKNYLNCLALRWPIKALFPLCFCGRFQVSLPGCRKLNIPHCYSAARLGWFQLFIPAHESLHLHWELFIHTNG